MREINEADATFGFSESLPRSLYDAKHVARDPRANHLAAKARVEDDARYAASLQESQRKDIAEYTETAVAEKMMREEDSSRITSTNKDLLRFEHLRSSSIIPGARLRSFCRAAHPSTTAEVSRLPFAESSVLDRVKAFLPILEEANQKLKTDIKDKGADEVNIEVLSKNEQASYVEMDLALGVADLQTPDAVQAAERLVGQAACRELDIVSESEILIVNGHKDDDGIVQGGMRKRPKIERLN